MAKKNAISLIGRIRDESNKLILSELEKHGVTEIAPSHGGIFLALYRHHRLTMKELSEEISRSKPTVTVLVNKLLKLGYIEKRKDLTDQRISYITLTEKGEALKPIFDEVSHTLNTLVYGNMSEDEQTRFEETLNKILDRF
ncbi:MarR family winged helix-turn-helix transcriptional regulator [Exiguobacterium algae]|uniref:MarR family winged helix-turn-helix transcriptional regulator n=1 Tax=Exiguobacterium algae TaxID=2751250 RepID=UPI001BEAAEB4|nr:MarR family transcriptional regulator [Exiguobacterium algae]